jgi:hypothetical protein
MTRLHVLSILMGRAPCWFVLSFFGGRLRECDNPAMSRLEMPFDGTLAVAHQSRVALLHTEVPRELSGKGTDRGWRIASSKRCDAIKAIAKFPFKSSYALRPEYSAALDG